MASIFIKNFAIENDLTVDYGYTYGWYRGFYISIKEGMSYKILTIITKLGDDKENLKKVLTSFNEDLEKYCVNDSQFNSEYLQFTFNLNNDKAKLVVEFIDKFIDFYRDNALDETTFCHLCNKPIEQGEKVSTVDVQGILYPVHENCYEQGKEKMQKSAKEKYAEINKNRSFVKGLIGAILFSILFVAILIGMYTLKEYLLTELSSDTSSYDTNAANLFHYLPSLLGIAAPFLIDAGYQLLKGTRGNKRYATIIICSYVAAMLGIWFGFSLSIFFLIEGDYTYGEIVSQIMQIMKIYPSFRLSFIIFAVLTLVFTTVGVIIKFTTTKEVQESEIATIDKLK